MSNKFSKYAHLLVAISVLLAMTGLYFYLYIQTQNNLDISNTKRQELRERERARMEGTGLTTLLSATEADRGRLYEFFVPAENAVEAIKAIESIGTDTGADVSIASVSSTDSDKEPFVGKVSASVSVRGSWRDVTEAIYMFESLPYGSSINNMTMRLSDEKTSIWQADFSLSILTLRRSKI